MSVAELEPDLREIDIAPNQRYGFVGKTGSGKTWHAIALASILVPYTSRDWQVWWIDTKDDFKDLDSLYRWGFRVNQPPKPKSNGILSSIGNLWTPEKPEENNPRKLFLVRGGNIHEQVEEIASNAYSQGGVLLCIDEYTQVVKSPQVAGKELLNVFQRGRGRDVGLIGLTQEPVYVPRQLLSQATHQFLFNVSYPHDIQYLSGLFGGYIRPMRLPIEDTNNWGHTKKSDHKHGFYHVAVDYDGEGSYYLNQYQWFKNVLGRFGDTVGP